MTQGVLVGSVTAQATMRAALRGSERVYLRKKPALTGVVGGPLTGVVGGPSDSSECTRGWGWA